MQNIWLYIRSTPTKPPSAQRDGIREYLSKNNIKLTGEEVERAGTKGFPAFERILSRSPDLIILSNTKQIILKSLPFFALLRKAKDFVLLDTPACTPATLDITEERVKERLQYHRTRTKTALKKLKNKGVKLGATRPGVEHVPDIFMANIAKGQKKAAKLRTIKADNYYAGIMPIMIKLRKQQYSDQEVANELNDLDYTTQVDGLFHQVAVMRLFKRWEKNEVVEGAKQGRRYQAKEFPFRAGPYKPPLVAIGDTIIDRFTDKSVKVVDKKDGWPLRKDGSFILTGDLVLAVLGETTNSICYNWKVHHKTVRAWKEKLAGQTRNIQPLLAQKLEEVKRNADTWSIRTAEV